MVPSFSTLWVAAVATALFGAWILARFIRLNWTAAFAISSLKAAIPFVYFLEYFRHGWMRLDDVSYYNVGLSLLYKGNNPFLIFLTPDGRAELFNLAGGQHVLYYWYNLLATYLFGPSYASPVFLNVASTFISGAFLYKMVLSSGFEERYARWLTVFFLLHWDLISWSSFLNLKEPLVLMFTIGAVYAGQELVRTRRARYVLPLAFFVFCFWYIRLYVPAVLAVAFGVWFFLAVAGWARLLWVSAAILAFFAALPANYWEFISGSTPERVPFSLLSMMLSPRPWSVDPDFSFLMPASVLHWIFFVPALIGAAGLCIKNRNYQLSALLYAGTVCSYAFVPDILTPRHRLHILWALAWAQFDFFWHLSSRKAFWAPTTAPARALPSTNI